MNHELKLNELDTISGGLARNPYRDNWNQQEANLDKGGDTVGGSIGGTLVGPATGGAGSTGGHPFDY